MSEFNARRRKQLEEEAQQAKRNHHNQRVLNEMKKEKQQQTTTASAATPTSTDRGLSQSELLARIERLNRSVERITALMKELRGEVELSTSTDKGVTR
jgi:hypothetical protein